jgi:hypothetical protein
MIKKLFPRQTPAAWIIAGIMAIVFPSTATASLIDWAVSGTFGDGETLTGTFTYDADTGTASNWDFITTGSVFPFFPFEYTPSNSSYTLLTTDGSAVIPEKNILDFHNALSVRDLELSFTPDLSNAGGTADMSNLGLEVANPTGREYAPTRAIVSGTAIAVPEPATLVILLTGQIFGFGVWRRRKIPSS